MNIVGQLGKLEKAILIGDDKINDIHVSVVDWPDDPQEIEQNTIKNAQKKGYSHHAIFIGTDGRVATFTYDPIHNIKSRTGNW